MAPLVIGLIVMAAGWLSLVMASLCEAPRRSPLFYRRAGQWTAMRYCLGHRPKRICVPALTLLTVAYQVSPVLFRSALLQLRESAAAAMNESTLPFAFYGITYLPLVGLLVASAALSMRAKGPARCAMASVCGTDSQVCQRHDADSLLSSTNQPESVVHCGSDRCTDFSASSIRFSRANLCVAIAR